MTWVKLDDRWTDEPMIQQLSFQTRWHYLGMLSWCCRMDQYDGVMRHVDAWRASDVDDPVKAIQELCDVGLLVPAENNGVQLTQMERHALPPHLRDGHRKQAQRERKQRQRDREFTGDVPSDVTRDGGEEDNVTGDVTRDIGVGVGVGTGTALASSSDETSTAESREISPSSLRSLARDAPDDIPPGETRNPVGTGARVKDRALRLIANVTGRTTGEVRHIVNKTDTDYAEKLWGLIEEGLRPALVAGYSDTDILAELRRARDGDGIETFWLPVTTGDGGWTS